MHGTIQYGLQVIALLDYGAGNLRSVFKALVHVGADVKLVTRPEELDQSSAVVLPGVGAFDDCLNSMRKQELLGAIRDFINSDRPFLGICVGYQALFEKSEEFNSCAAGIGIFPGHVVRFQNDAGLKIPQIGWNKVRIMNPDCPIYKGITDHSYFYFVHSFYPIPQDSSIIASETDYGTTFASSIWRRNVFATQFHPEKSQRVGLQLLKNFRDLVE